MTSSPRVLAVDRWLIDTLERSFGELAGPDGVIDEAELKSALGLRSEYLAKRMLALLDTNQDGVVQKSEFIAGVRKLVFGTDAEKLRFAFDLHDHDGDGTLDERELVRMVAISLADADVMPSTSQQPELLARRLLRGAHAKGDGRLTFDEFQRALSAHPEVLREMTRSEAQWMAPSADVLGLLEGRADPRERPRRTARFLSNRWPLAMVLGLFALLNVGLLVGTLASELAAPFADPWLALGRATAACLTVDGALIFVPVLRRLMTRVRASLLGALLPVDDALDLHRWLGHFLFGLSVAHGVAITGSFAVGHGVGALLGLLGTFEGATGGALLAVLVVMWAFALERVRRSKQFERFYFTHLLYVVWLGLALVHAPSYAVFGGLAAVGLAVEHAVRLVRRASPTQILELDALRSGVTRVVIEKPEGFTFEAGDYVFVCIPAIAKREWHPFTISSPPESSVLELHVRSLGNWTSALRRLAEAREKSDEASPLRIEVDGPYGSPSARIAETPHAILVGAGIGVTPFASVLESLFRRAETGRPAPETLDFFWLNRDQYSFEWFAALLARLEATPPPPALTLHLHMTGGRAGATSLALQLARAMAKDEGRRDMLTRLSTPTHFGPPQWESVLGEIAKKHGQRGVAVFFCGPPGLGVRIRAACRAVGIPFHEERF
jgi:predicted ferric reductase/Ca2+-binding EF-hand superfamily protein